VIQDWLLVETLGDQPVVVAHGRQMKNFVPLGTFLRRNPDLAAIHTAIAETVSSSTGLASITPKNKRVIRTEPIQMTDGRMHAVHVWCGPTDDEPPERPIPGPLKWDLTSGESWATVEFLTNAGMDPAHEPLTGRAFVEDIPSRSLNQDESKALSLTIDAAPDRTYSATWDFADKIGGFRRVGWCARTLMEPNEDGTEHLVARSMNLLETVSDSPLATGNLADRIVDGLAQPGAYRVIVDLNTWTLLKWIDEPCPYFDWRASIPCGPPDCQSIDPHQSGRVKHRSRSRRLPVQASAASFSLTGTRGISQPEQRSRSSWPDATRNTLLNLDHSSKSSPSESNIFDKAASSFSSVSYAPLSIASLI
jgi:hypothetical protein